MDESVLLFFQPILTMLGSNCLSEFANKKSLPHLRLFLAMMKTFKHVYSLEFIVQSLTGSDVPEARKSHPTQLLEACASHLLNATCEASPQSTDAVELCVEVMIWIAIHTGQADNAAEFFLQFCQVCIHMVHCFIENIALGLVLC